LELKKHTQTNISVAASDFRNICRGNHAGRGTRKLPKIPVNSDGNNKQNVSAIRNERELAAGATTRTGKTELVIKFICSFDLRSFFTFLLKQARMKGVFVCSQANPSA
jgi:hypothetical protein